MLRPLGVAIAIGFAGGPWPPLDPALLVGRNIGVQGFYLGRLMQREPDLVREAAHDLLRLWGPGSVHPIVGATFPLAEAAEAHRLVESGARRARSCSSREGDRHRRRLGIGAAMVARLRAEGIDVEVLDLTTGFDVTEPDHWDAVGPVEIACLNAGVLGGAADPAELSLERYRRAMRVNVDGVVLGVRRLARVMPAGGRIVATASLAGLTAMPDDPVYAATKHAVVGFVRSVAPPLEARGISINAVCPGIADTPMLGGDARSDSIAARASRCSGRRGRRRGVARAQSGVTGHAWVVQPGRAPLDFRFPNVPGARTPAGEPGAPPLSE